MKVSYRDKILLIILVCAITLAGAFLLVIKPKIDEISENNNKIVTAEKKENDIKSKISKTKTTSLKKTLDEQNAKNEDYKQIFLQPKESYDIDRFVQGVLNADVASPIVYTPLKITGPASTDLTKYTYSPVLINSTIQQSGSNTTNNSAPAPKNDAQKNNDQTNKNQSSNTPASNTTSGGSSSSTLPAYQIEIGYKCSLDSIEKFLTRITAEKGMSVVINEFTLGYEADTTQPAGIDEKTGTAIYKKLEGNLVSGSIKMTIYFLEPKEFASPKE